MNSLERSWGGGRGVVHGGKEEGGEKEYGGREEGTKKGGMKGRRE